MPDHEKDLSFKDLFFPFTTKKAICILAIVGFLVFINSLLNPFILDDFPQIIYNPVVRHLSNLFFYFFHSFAFPGNSDFKLLHIYYKPLLFTTYTLLFSIFGNSTIPFHLLQIIIHIINSSLVFLLFSRVLKRPLAFLLSLVFLIHPINSEAVIYIANLQDVLFVLFGLLALHSIEIKNDRRLSLKRRFFIALLLLLSLFSKETGILFSFIILIYAWLFFRPYFKKLTLTVTATLIIYALFRFIASFNSTSIITLSLIQQESFSVRILSIPKIIYYYFSTFLFPIHLATGQEWLVKTIDFQNFLLPLFVDILVFVGLIVSGLFIYKKKNQLFKQYLFFIIWFCLGIGIHIQIIPLDLTVADRWFYFPIIGLLGIIGILFSCFINPLLFRYNFLKKLFPVLIFLILFGLSLQTVVRNSQWQTPLRLYSHDVKYLGLSPVIYSYYGALLMTDGQYDLAKPYLEQSVSIDPKISSNIVNLAMWYEHKKDFAMSKELYLKNIRSNNGISSYISASYEGLVRISLLNEKNPFEAKRLSESALKNYPMDTLLMEYLAVSQYELGEKKNALQTIQKIYDYAPDEQNSRLYLLIKNDKLTLPN